jgi:hypothetical protein
MGCHDQRWAHRLRRFSALLMAPIATVGLRPVMFTLRGPASAGRRGDGRRLQDVNLRGTRNAFDKRACVLPRRLEASARARGPRDRPRA